MKTKTTRGIRIVCFLLAALMLAACEVDTSDDDGSGYDDGGSGWNSGGDGGYGDCPTYGEPTEINGVENDLSTRMYSENGVGQVYLRTVRNSDNFVSVQWSIGANTQTCTTGSVVQQNGASFLPIRMGTTQGNFMDVLPGLNDIDYQAYGCTLSDCNTLIESGTIVLNVEVP